MKNSLIILCSLFLIHLFLTTLAYQNHIYSGDGFNNFVWYCHIAENFGLWEGPLYSFMLDNHSYITSLLYVPVFFFFKTPLALHYVNFAAFFFSAFFMLRFASQLLPPLATLLLTLAYTLHPIFFEGIYGWLHMLYQPEVILLVLLPSATLAFWQKRHKTFSFLLAMIALSKEEYIAVVLLFFFWCHLAYWVVEGKWRLQKSEILLPLTSIILASALALFVLAHYKALPVYHHVGQNATFGQLLRIQNMLSPEIFANKLWLAFIFTCGATLPLFLILSFYSPKRILPFTLFSLGFFIYARLMADRIVYGAHMHLKLFEGKEWATWSRAVIPPMLFLTLLVSLAAAKRYLSPKRLNTGLVLLIIGFILQHIFVPSMIDKMLLQLPSLHRPEGVIPPEEFAEMQDMRQKLPPGDRSSAVMLPVDAWDNFFFDYSFFQYIPKYLPDTIKSVIFTRWIGQITWAIIPREHQSIWEQKSAEYHFVIKDQSKRYILYKRDTNLSPLTPPPVKWW